MMVLLQCHTAGTTRSARRECLPRMSRSRGAPHATAAERLAAARAEALFTSPLSADTHPDRDQVVAAIKDAFGRLGGTRSCACEVAAEYGDRPELAARRMRWARRVVSELFPQRPAAARHGSARYLVPRPRTGAQG